MVGLGCWRNGDCASVACTIPVAQEGNFYIRGEAGTGKSVVLAHIAAKLALSVRHSVPIRMMV